MMKWYVLDRWLHTEAETAGSGVAAVEDNTNISCIFTPINKCKTLAESCYKYFSIFHFDVKKKKNSTFNAPLSLCSSKYYSKSKGKSTIVHLVITYFAIQKRSMKTCIIANIVTSRK